MAFVNTRDTIGDQATVDGLVEHSLTELKEDGIAKIMSYALYRNDTIQSVEFPNATHIDYNSLAWCTNLEVVKIGGSESSTGFTIQSEAFYNDSKLKHLIIDRPAMATLTATSALTGTLIEKGEGAVYVPESLVDTYKSNNKWKNYFIRKLADYPLSVFDSIEDSWSDIFANASYATDYTVKGTKTLELTDGTKIKMDLAAIDTDVKSDNSGTAKMTWICHGVPYVHSMNATRTSSGGWADSEMRSWLISDILSKIPTEIKSHIVSVKKSYRTKSPNDETLWSDDEIWIPSYNEVGFTDSSYIESSGVTYPTLFPSGTGTTANNARKKYNTSSSAKLWWLRSAYSADIFSTVHSAGSANGSYADSSISVAFGFCTD